MRTWADFGITPLYSATGEVRTPCPRCGSPGPHRVASGTPPHYALLVCGQCGRWLRWLPRPRPGATPAASSSPCPRCDIIPIHYDQESGLADTATACV